MVKLINCITETDSIYRISESDTKITSPHHRINNVFLTNFVRGIFYQCALFDVNAGGQEKDPAGQTQPLFTHVLGKYCLAAVVRFLISWIICRTR